MGHGEIADDKTRIALLLPKKLKDDLKVMADEERRSVNNMIVKILLDYRDTYGVNYGLKRR